MMLKTPDFKRLDKDALLVIARRYHSLSSEHTDNHKSRYHLLYVLVYAECLVRGIREEDIMARPA